MGRPRRADLLPIFRSDAQARVLAAIFLASEERPPHVRVIADETGLPYSTVQREVAALEAAGLVRGTTWATAKVVRPDESSPYFTELQSLILRSYGPAAMLAPALEGRPGVVDAYIFGSWAARYHGEAGGDPATSTCSSSTTTHRLIRTPCRNASSKQASRSAAPSTSSSPTTATGTAHVRPS